MGTNELKAAQVESYLDVAREQGFNAVLTISNQLAGAPGEHPLTVDKRKLKKVSLHHLSWSQIRTEALVEQGNKDRLVWQLKTVPHASILPNDP